VGTSVGAAAAVGTFVGASVGAAVGAVGAAVGAFVGDCVLQRPRVQIPFEQSLFSVQLSPVMQPPGAQQEAALVVDW
jgi:hypothetical protein